MSVDKKKPSKATSNPMAENEKIDEEMLESVSEEKAEVNIIEPVNVDTTAIQVDELDVLKEELEEAKKKSKEYFEGWQRERADLLNYKKRVERDQVQLYQVITADVLKKFLTVLDDIELALKNRPQDPTDQNWWEGVELINRKLLGILESEGVKRIPAEGKMFDPNLHEAISHDEDPNFESGQVIEVVQQGYMIGDRVIRPALVRVAR